MAAKSKKPQSKPAWDPESREKQLTSLAVNLAEKQLTEGTASPSVITHYLKLASKKESIEREILQEQSKLIKAKTEALGKGSESDEIANAAILALSDYKSKAN